MSDTNKRRIGGGNNVALRSIQAAVVDYFAKNKNVLLVFHFGSSQTGPITQASDVDLGVLFTGEVDPFELASMREGLSLRIRKDVDLVVLNGASPIIGMQVLKKGRLLFARDMKVYHRFYAETVDQYDDLKQIRKSGEESILKGRIYA
ncbi:MAG: nucleotidyltransferase domain-containing protein [Nitrospiraceae bacterium]|nr:nucleotidyltransferase domain-containing protein [Nitrospiraceae bacterium]